MAKLQVHWLFLIKFANAQPGVDVSYKISLSKQTFDGDIAFGPSILCVEPWIEYNLMQSWFKIKFRRMGVAVEVYEVKTSLMDMLIR